MKKLKKNWLLIIIGVHIAFRIALYGFVTNDEVNITSYKTTAEIENNNQALLDQQIVMLD